MDIIKEIIARAQANKQRIVLPEGTEERTLKAANRILTDEVADLIILGDPAEIDEAAKKWGLGNIHKATIIDPATSPKKEEYAQLLFELRKKKGMTLEEAQQKVLDPLFFGCLMIKAGDADGQLAGARNTTGNVLRPALQIIKTAPGITCVSGAMLLLTKAPKYGTNGYGVLVARTATHDLYSKWQYYVRPEEGSDFVWQDEYPTAEQMERSQIMENNYACSMPWVFKDGDYYYMTAQGPYFAREVYIYRSKSPYGPFGEKRLLFVLPGQLDKLGPTAYHWLYMVNLHPALSRAGELVFTTNSDPDDFWKNFNDPGSADYYRPFFYRVFDWKSLFGDDTTSGIDGLSAPQTVEDNHYYNLQGIRVDHPTRGIYIRNGRKVVIK